MVCWPYFNIFSRVSTADKANKEFFSTTYTNEDTPVHDALWTELWRHKSMKETKMAHTGGGSGSQENIPNEAPTNVFANDGSFLERFKKQMEAMEKESKAANDSKLRKATRTSTEEEERTLDDKKDGEKANEKPEATSSLLLSQVWLTVDRILWPYSSKPLQVVWWRKWLNSRGRSLRSILCNSRPLHQFCLKFNFSLLQTSFSSIFLLCVYMWLLLSSCEILFTSNMNLNSCYQIQGGYDNYLSLIIGGPKYARSTRNPSGEREGLWYAHETIWFMRRAEFWHLIWLKLTSIISSPSFDVILR